MSTVFDRVGAGVEMTWGGGACAAHGGKMHAGTLALGGIMHVGTCAAHVMHAGTLALGVIMRERTCAAHDGELLFGVMRLGHMTLVAEFLRNPAREGALT